MNKKVLIFFCFLIGLNPLKSQVSLDEIIENLNKSVSNYKTINYEAEFNVKYLSDSDTTKHHGVVIYEKDNTDTLFNGKINITQDYIYQTIYNVKDFMFIQHKKKEITTYDINKYQSQILESNTIKSYLPEDIFKGINRQDLNKENAKLNLLQNESDSLFSVIQITWSDTLDFSDKKRKIWINNKSFLPEKIEVQIKYKDDYQYKVWKVFSITLNNDFPDFKIPKNYTISSYKELTFEDIQNNLLKLGEKSPDFSGITLESKKFKKNKTNGKYVLLDFSFIGCLPCIESIPFLNELQEENNNNNFTVIGINPIDKKIVDLEKFSKKYNVQYPIISVDRSIADLYHVSAYPTYYLLDVDGKVLLHSIGLSDQKKQELKTLLKKH